MTEYLGYGMLLGLSAGFSPGPLMALVLAQTLRYGTQEGIKVALSPLATDAPIITLTVLLLNRLPPANWLFGGISIIGGLFVAYLAWGTIRTTRIEAPVENGSPRSLGKGILTNLLSPHPYLFWLTVGAPAITRGWNTGPGVAVAFIAGFLGSLIGAKIFVAVAAGRSTRLLTGRIYGWVMRLLGILLFICALMLLRDGLNLIARS